jgi:sulfonate transport system ATP-binding protein
MPTCFKRSRQPFEPLPREGLQLGPKKAGTFLEINDLQKKYEYQMVLNGVNLRIQPGEFVAVIGRSGCGKSTLLRLIAGLESPTSGEVIQDGQRIAGLNPEARVMFQDSRLLPWKNVFDNIALGLRKKKEAEKERIELWLKQVGLEDYGLKWPSVLSGGQRQRVALARALVCRPHLLLLDEPLGALDAFTRMEMQRLIERLWLEQKFTSLLVTHDVEEAVTLADRVVLLKEGRIAKDLKNSLPRPRQRSQALFASVVGTILDQVMEASDEGRALLPLRRSEKAF